MRWLVQTAVALPGEKIGKTVRTTSGKGHVTDACVHKASSCSMSRAGKRRRLTDDHDHSPFESIKRRLQSDKSTTRKVRARAARWRLRGCLDPQVPLS